MKRVLACMFPLAAILAGAQGEPGPAVPGPRESAPQPPGRFAGAPPEKSPAASGQEECAIPAGEFVPAERILQDLAEGKDVSLVGRLIEGSIDADSLWPASEPGRRMVQRVVRGRLRLESCRVTGSIALRRCVLLKSLEFPCTEVRGEVDLSDSEIHLGLDATRSRVTGGVRLDGLSIGEDLSLAGARLDDRLDLQGVRVRGAVGLQGAVVKRDLDIAGALVGSLDLSATRVQGQARLQDLLVRSTFTAGEAVMSRGLVLRSARVVGNASASGVASVDGVLLSDCAFDEDLDLDLSSRTSLTVSNVTVRRDLSLFDGRLGTVTIERLWVAGESDLESAVFSGRVVIRETDFGREFSASDARFSGDCEFVRVRFPGKDPMEAASFAREPALIDTVLPTPPRFRSHGASSDLEEPEGADDDE